MSMTGSTREWDITQEKEDPPQISKEFPVHLSLHFEQLKEATNSVKWPGPRSRHAGDCDCKQFRCEATQESMVWITWIDTFRCEQVCFSGTLMSLSMQSQLNFSKALAYRKFINDSLALMRNYQTRPHLIKSQGTSVEKKLRVACC